MTLDCQTCGACCLGRVLVGNDPIPAALERAREGRFLLPSNGRCAALAGKVGYKVRCTVYADRPRKCHMFQAATPECLTKRQEAGIG